jgi:two-component system, cell cycle sensor histidine kinase and response regulator CckA
MRPDSQTPLQPVRVLILEDMLPDTEILVRELRKSGFEPNWQRVDTEADFLAALDSAPEVILADYTLPQFDGMRAVQLVRARGMDTPFILISGTVGEEMAVKAIKLGADDFLLKDRLARLGPAVAGALENKRLRQDRKRAEEAHTRLATIVENTADIVFQTDAGNRTIYMNTAGLRMLGKVRQQDVVGSPVTDFFPSESAEQVLGEGLESAKNDGSWLADLEMYGADGRLAPVSVLLLVERTADRSVAQATYIVRDLSERKRVQDEIRNQQVLLQLVFDALPTWVSVKDRAGRYILVSQQQIVDTGVRLLDYLGRTTEQVGIATAETAARIFDLDRQVVESGERVEIPENIFIASNGTESVQHTVKVPLRDGAGQLVGTVSISQDITERKRQALEIQQSEERYRKLVEESILGIMIVQKGKIVFCNRQTAKMFGYERADELVGIDAIEVVHPEDRHAALETGNQLTDPNASRLHPSYRGVRKDKSVMWYEPRHSMVEWQGRRAVQWILVDVTQERALERQLEMAQRMESVGRLAGGIAHDFNNILAIILSYAEFILEAAGDNQALRDDALVIQESGERAAGLTRQLLAFSRRQVLQLNDADVNALVTGLTKMLVRLIGEDVTLDTALAPQVHLIRADSTQVEQILMNLVVNARDAMPTGGRITIETANRTLDDNYAASHGIVKPGEYVMLSVTDTGIGMDAETQKKIFEPFFTTKEPGKGTGLGLATVYGIVRQMDGAIFVYSEPNKGTTFKIYFPAIEQQNARATLQEKAKAVPRATETILLVEDDVLVRRSATRILEGNGYKVVAAGTAGEALEIANNGLEKLDLLISDVVMPEKGGPELWEAIRQVRDIPALFMSGYTDDAIVRHGILEGKYPFLTKPFARDSLLGKVREVLDSRRAGIDTPKAQ